jgi:hypothetical protein
MKENKQIAIDRLAGKPFGERDDSDAGFIEQEKPFQWLVTKGMVQADKSSPPIEKENSGLVVWGKGINNLEQALIKIGADAITVASKVDLDTANFPIYGLEITLGDKWTQILNDSGLVDDYPAGFISINPELYLYAIYQEGFSGGAH